MIQATQQQAVGPTEFFVGPMAAPITRRVIDIYILEDATFTVLDFEFPAGTVSPAPAASTAVTFPALAVVSIIKKFQLLTGTIQVVYAGAPSPALQ